MRLGCNQKEKDFLIDGKGKARGIVYDMESFLEQRVRRYQDVAGGVAMKTARAPFLGVDGPKGKRRDAAKQQATSLRWLGRVDVDDPELEIPKEEEPPIGEEPGELAGKAASVLTKSLYAARVARFDLLRAAQGLARYLTRWTKRCDEQLYRLMCCIRTTKAQKMVGWVGNSLSELEMYLHTDASFAEPGDQNSASGCHVCVKGSSTYFPIAGRSKRQGCVSSSTTEAEPVAAHEALRTTGFPAWDGFGILRGLLGLAPSRLRARIDNAAMLEAIRAGRNLTMRHLPRAHGVAIGWLHERRARHDVHVSFIDSSMTTADVCHEAVH